MAPPPPQPPHTPPRLPSQLQTMMRQMQKRQPKFQQQIQLSSVDVQQNGGPYRGRGRGQGTFQQQTYRPHRDRTNQRSYYKQQKGQRATTCDGCHLFRPSFLENPWNGLEVAHEQETSEQGVEFTRTNVAINPIQHMDPRHSSDTSGRVFFKPSFLKDPWQLA